MQISNRDDLDDDDDDAMRDVIITPHRVRRPSRRPSRRGLKSPSRAKDDVSRMVFHGLNYWLL